MGIRNIKQWRSVFGINLLLALAATIIYFLIHRYKGFQITFFIATGFFIAVGVCQLANLVLVYRKTISIEIFTLCLLLLFLFLFSITKTGNLFLFIFPVQNYLVLKMSGIKSAKRR
jgi:hypothetical protein